MHSKPSSQQTPIPAWHGCAASVSAHPLLQTMALEVHPIQQLVCSYQAFDVHYILMPNVVHLDLGCIWYLYHKQLDGTGTDISFECFPNTTDYPREEQLERKIKRGHRSTSAKTTLNYFHPINREHHLNEHLEHQCFKRPRNLFMSIYHLQYITSPYSIHEYAMVVWYHSSITSTSRHWCHIVPPRLKEAAHHICCKQCILGTRSDMNIHGTIVQCCSNGTWCFHVFE